MPQAGQQGLGGFSVLPFSPPHLTPSSWFKNQQITGRRSLEREKSQSNVLFLPSLERRSSSGVPCLKHRSPLQNFLGVADRSARSQSASCLPSVQDPPLLVPGAERDTLEAGRATRGLQCFGGQEFCQRPGNGSLGDCPEK